MELSPDRPIRLDRLDHAWSTSFVDLQYRGLPPGSSLFDPEYADARDKAIRVFKKYLQDEGEEETELVRDGLAWALNLPPERFRQTIAPLVPYPRLDAEDIHRFLEFVFDRVFGTDWNVPDFDADNYEVTQ